MLLSTLPFSIGGQITPRQKQYRAFIKRLTSTKNLFLNLLNEIIKFLNLDKKKTCTVSPLAGSAIQKRQMTFWRFFAQQL
jgi:hypothetical protein